MKYAAIIFIALVAGLLAFVYIVARSDRHARIVYSRFELRRALQDLQETGSLREYTNSLSINFSRPFIYTNIVTVGGTNYRCAVAYDEHDDVGFLAVTTNGVFIYFDK
jgi:hypothetical protein